MEETKKLTERDRRTVVGTVDIPKNLFNLESIEEVRIHYHPKYKYTKPAYGSIEFKVDDVSGEKKFEADTLDELMINMRKFVDSLNYEGN